MPLPQTEIPGRLQSQLAGRGIRLTAPRRAILSVIETATKHLDASQILRKARTVDASVNRSTVYRTLDLLKRQGLIDELDLMHLNGEGHYYERKLGRDHIHMACLRCGKITEFVSKTFESLKKQLQRDCRFHIIVARLEVGGYCPACPREATESDSPTFRQIPCAAWRSARRNVCLLLCDGRWQAVRQPERGPEWQASLSPGLHKSLPWARYRSRAPRPSTS